VQELFSLLVVDDVSSAVKATGATEAACHIGALSALPDHAISVVRYLDLSGDLE